MAKTSSSTELRAKAYNGTAARAAGSAARTQAFAPQWDWLGTMGSVGNYHKNTMCESFFSTLECELIERESYATRSEARLSVFDFIEGFITHTGCTRPSATSHR